MIDDTQVLSMAKGVSFQNLGAGEGAVVLTIATGQLYTCNDTTAHFLAAIDGIRSFASIVASLLQTFDAPIDELRSDMSALAEQLIADGIIH